jgi:hypothetical protein
MSFPHDPFKVKVEVAWAADLTNSASWVYTDISPYVNGSVVITRGRSNETSKVDPTRIEFRLRNTDGRFSPHLPTGANYPNVIRNVPVQVSFDYGSGYKVRANGFIDGWHPIWPSGNQSYAEVAVEASGIIRRLNQGAVLRSSLYRSLAGVYSWQTPAVAYWPCEDESNALGAASGIGGKPMAAFGSVSFAADAIFAGSGPLPKLALGASLVGTVPPYAATNTWKAVWVFRISTAISVASQIGEVRSLGTIVRWEILWEPGPPQFTRIKGYNSAGTELFADGGTTLTHADGSSIAVGEQMAVELEVSEIAGPNVSWSYIVAAANGGGTGKSGSTAGSVGNVRAVQFTSNNSLDQATCGHFAVSTSLLLFSDFEAAGGHAGESTAHRIDRLCAEEGIDESTLFSITTSADTLMGAQSRTRFIDLIREVEDAEQGLALETVASSLHSPMLNFVDRGSRENRTVDMTLDCAERQVRVDFEPNEDDQHIHNDVTASRMGGASARAPSITADVYSEEQTLNLQYDADLPYYASWLQHIGTADEMRISSLSWDLAAHPELIAAWITCDVGSWLSVTNLPSQYPPGPLGLVLEGWTETLDAVTWRIANANTSPSRLWEVWQLEDTRLGRLESDGTTLAAGVTSTATSLSLATPSGPLWTTASGDRPFDIEVAGERMTVTNLTGSTSPQTATVTRSVNGVVKAQASGAAVTPWQNGFLAL